MLFPPGSQLDQILGGRLIPYDFQAHLRACQPCLAAKLLLPLDLEGRAKIFCCGEQRCPDRHVVAGKYGDLFTLYPEHSYVWTVFPDPTAIFLADKIEVPFFARVNLSPGTVDLRVFGSLRPGGADTAGFPRFRSFFA